MVRDLSHRSWRGAAVLAAAIMLVASPVRAAGTSPTPSSAQPTLPSAVAPGGSPPVFPTVQETLGSTGIGSTSHRHAARHERRHRPVARRYDPVPPDLVRPAVAGVVLLAPLPRPPEPPHFDVPLPAYYADSFTTLFSTPPAPIVCHHAPREPGVPDPDLYRERTLRCEADNP